MAKALTLLTVFLLAFPYPAQSKSAGKGKTAEDPGCKSCLSQAAAAFASKNVDEAERLLSNWTGRCPKNAQLHLLYSTVLLRKGNCLDAEKEAAAAVQAQPDSQAARLQYGMTLVGNSHYTQAIPEFEKVTELNPVSYEAWSSLADLYKRDRQDELADRACKKAANVEPNTIAARLSVLQNLKRQGKFDKAKAEAQRLAQNQEYGPEFLQSLAAEALAVGAVDEAESSAKRAAEAYPRSQAALNTLAQASYLNGKYDACVETCDKLLAIQDTDCTALATRGLALVALGKTPDAEKSVGKAAELSPDSGVVLLSQGQLWLAQGNSEKAKEALKRGLAFDYKNKDALARTLTRLNLARIALQENDCEEAESQWQEAAQDPRARLCKLAEIGFELAQALEKSGEPKSSMEQYKLCLSLGLPQELASKAREAVARLGGTP